LSLSLSHVTARELLKRFSLNFILEGFPRNNGHVSDSHSGGYEGFYFLPFTGFRAGFLLGLFFYREDGGDMFLRIIS
jgi:hypothetical protein